MSDTTCTIGNCAKPNFAKGLCTTHYGRLRTHGDPNYEPPERAHDLTGKRFGALTAIRKIDKLWLCQCDCGATRMAACFALNAGDHTSCGNRALHQRKALPSYRAVHARLAADRGKAHHYPCVDCGNPADDWSYDYLDPDVLYSRTGTPYSTDQAHYHPRCDKCHGQHDEQMISRPRRDGKFAPGATRQG